MLNELRAFARRYEMFAPGDAVFCAVSGGPDSMALLMALYLLQKPLGITLGAAHFNHHLRGAESDRDEAFVRDFCAQYQIPLEVGGCVVAAGEKGLEAAAREVRYGFLLSLPGKIATAHTADDNAETVLLHLIRGTGLHGLGGIPPVRGRIVRPMLSIPRTQVLAFLAEYHIPYMQDSTNDTDAFLRNRVRRGVMPLLKAENPRLAEDLSAMALSLREEDALLQRLAVLPENGNISELRRMDPVLRRRALGQYLKSAGVREPEACHIAQAEALVFSDNPSARGNFPGGICIRREYDRLTAERVLPPLEPRTVPCPGALDVPEIGLRIVCGGAEGIPMAVRGRLVLRSRKAGDTIRTKSGRRLLKKLLIDRKIPAASRDRIPVLADEAGVLWVGTVGANLDRVTEGADALRIHVEYTSG